jgi:hypothetical protein
MSVLDVPFNPLTFSFHLAHYLEHTALHEACFDGRVWLQLLQIRQLPGAIRGPEGSYTD